MDPTTQETRIMPQISQSPHPVNPPPSQQPPVPTKPKNLFLLVLISIVIFLSLGVAVFLVYQNHQPTQQPTPSVSPSPTPEMDDLTADWKVYANLSDTYSFRYPLGLKSDSGAAVDGYESVRFTYVGPSQLASGRTQTELFDGYAFSVIKFGSVSQIDPKTEAEKQQNNSKEVCQNVGEITKTKIDGFDAYQYSEECFGNSTTIFTSDNKNVYSITQLYVGENQSRYRIITDQILSTFKFLGQSITTPISKYTCPSSEWVDCMPGPNIGKRTECTPEFLAWAKRNCPNFKGAAL